MSLELQQAAWTVQVLKSEPEFTTQMRDDLIMQWDQAKAALDAAKDAENTLRKLVFEKCFTDPKVGTNTLELGNAYKLKAVRKQNYKLDRDIDKVQAMVDKLSKIDNEGSFIADRLIKWSADISEAEYKSLDPKYKKIVDTVLVITDGTPSVELVTPKVKK